MSSFEAQAALASQASATRRQGPVAISAQQRVIPVAELTAPPVGAIAPFTPPTLDTKAAQDLEQAMQVFQQTGQAFGQLGRFANMTRELAVQEDVYREQFNTISAVSRMQERFQKGELNAAIDASPDIETFVKGQLAGKEFLTDSGRAVYQRAVSNAAADIYLKRGAERQKSEFAQFNRGIIAGLLLDDTPAGLRITPDQDYEAVQARFPWVDRPTFMSSTYGMALKEAASRGDGSMFERIGNQITDPVERVILVDSQRPELRSHIASQLSARRSAVAVAMKDLEVSDRPLAEKVLQLHDVLEQNVDDPQLRQGYMADFHMDLLKNAANGEEFDAIVESARALSEPMFARVEAKAKAQVVPVLTNAMQGAAASADPSFTSLVSKAAQGGVAPDAIANATRQYIERSQERRRVIATTEYAKIPTAETEAEIINVAKDRLEQYDSSKSPLENEAAGAITFEEYNGLVSEIGKVKKINATQDLLAQVMRRSVDLSPSDSKWDDLLEQSGAVRGGVIDPQAATKLLAGSGTMPARLLDTVYRSLQGPSSRRESAMQFLAQVSRTYTSDALSNINGFSIRETDAYGNMPTIAAIAEIMPTLAGLERDQAGNLTQKSLAAANALYDQAADANQDAQFVPMDSAALTNAFVVNGIQSIGGFAIQSRAAGILPTVDVIRSAVTQASGSRLNDLGVSGGALSDLSAEVASRVMKQWNPVLGSWKPDEREIKKQIAAETESALARHVIPKIGSRQFGASERSESYPTMEWDERLFQSIAMEQKMNIADIRAIIPVPMSGENEWFVGTKIGTDEDGNDRLRLDIVSVKPPPVTPEGVIRRSKNPSNMPTPDAQVDYR